MMGEAKDTVLELIRREGLIVVAIVALGWQVYFLTNQSQQQDALWRQELAEYRVMIQALDEKIGERWIKLADVSAQINVRLTGIEKDIEVLLERDGLNKETTNDRQERQVAPPRAVVE